MQKTYNYLKCFMYFRDVKSGSGEMVHWVGILLACGQHPFGFMSTKSDLSEEPEVCRARCSPKPEKSNVVKVITPKALFL